MRRRALPVGLHGDHCQIGVAVERLAIELIGNHFRPLPGAPTPPEYGVLEGLPELERHDVVEDGVDGGADVVEDTREVEEHVEEHIQLRSPVLLL